MCIFFLNSTISNHIESDSPSRAVKTSPRFTTPGESFAVEFVKICPYKTFWMRIFERTTFLLFRRCSIHVKLCIFVTYSARNCMRG